MHTRLLPWHTPLRDASRLRLVPRSLAAPFSLAEAAVLLLFGGMAAVLVVMAEFKLGIPGHAILRAVFPMALGLALVPRRGAGTVMGIGALVTTALLTLAGWGEKGLGAMTSLLLIGPFLDLAVHRSKTGRRVYYSLIAAGLLANLSALGIQAMAKSLGMTGGGGGRGGGGKSLAVWLPLALATYPVCGALAGLLSATAWFRWNSDPKQETPVDET